MEDINLINLEDVKRLQQAKKHRISLQSWTWAYYSARIFKYDGSINSILKNSCEEVIKGINNRTLTYESKSQRVNEFGNSTEEWLAGKLVSNGIDSKTLGNAYPDIRFYYNDKWYYIECKTQSNICADTSFRTFYASTPEPKTIKRKDIQDGFHLLAVFETKGKGKNVKYTGNYRIYDLVDFTFMDYGSIHQGCPKDYLKLNIVCQNTN
jgi:hypothetical protein